MNGCFYDFIAIKFLLTTLKANIISTIPSNACRDIECMCVYDR